MKGHVKANRLQTTKMSRMTHETKLNHKCHFLNFYRVAGTATAKLKLKVDGKNGSLFV